MKTLALICFAAGTLVSVEALGAVGVYFPPEAVIVRDGNSSLAGPFNTSTSSRLQQVYAHDAFPDPGFPAAFLIHGIYFRVDENAGAFDETFPSVQVTLSTTSRGPDGLSTLFSENIGPDQTTVFGPGPLHLSGAGSGFPVGFMFERTYLYDPSAGNLLVDIRNFGPGNASVLDAFNVLGDSVSIVGNEEVNSPTGSRLTRGLATMFWVDIVPIPEPGAGALLLLGLLAVGWNWRRSRRASICKG